jgi:hypothetical protein
MSLLVSIS